MSRLSTTGIARAAATIDPVFLHSPQVSFEPLSRVLGAEVVLKVETLNPIRCFKGRGADYCVQTLTDRTPLVVASAGNFGQGMAYSAGRHCLSIEIFAATSANPLKVERMRALGATVILSGADFDAAKDAARRHSRETGRRFIEDGREPSISEGAGTIAQELTAWPNCFDSVLVPLGNGALINGIGTWFKARSPETRVVGVCASGAPAMEISWRTGRLTQTDRVDTIADGIAVRVPVPEALEDMRHYVDEVLLVDDTAIRQAMDLVLRHAGLVVEPAGAAGIAALIAFQKKFAGQLVATPLCGSNVGNH